MKENKSYYVYVLTFPNGKRYVGYTKNRPEKRWCNGHGYRAKRIRAAIDFYGWDNIEKETFVFNTDYDAKYGEMYLILYYQSHKYDYGYNNNRSFYSQLPINDRRSYSKEYYQLTRTDAKLYYQQNKDRISKQRELRKDRLKEYAQSYYLNNKHRMLNQSKEYRKKHREHLIEYNRQYYYRKKQERLNADN